MGTTISDGYFFSVYPNGTFRDKDKMEIIAGMLDRTRSDDEESTRQRVMSTFDLRCLVPWINHFPHGALFQINKD